MFAQVAKRVSVVQFAKRSLSTAAEGANGIKVKSIAYGENGNPAEVLKLVETTIEPSKVTGATWALVKQLASPINPADINLVCFVIEFAGHGGFTCRTVVTSSLVLDPSQMLNSHAQSHSNL